MSYTGLINTFLLGLKNTIPKTDVIDHTGLTAVFDYFYVTERYFIVNLLVSASRVAAGLHKQTDGLHQ